MSIPPIMTLTTNEDNTIFNLTVNLSRDAVSGRPVADANKELSLTEDVLDYLLRDVQDFLVLTESVEALLKEGKLVEHFDAEAGIFTYATAEGVE